MDNNRVIYTVPYESEVEYLKLIGTQWLDTGYKGNINTAMECVCKITDTTYGYVIAGSRTSPTVGNISFVCGKTNGSYQYICDFGDYTYSRLLVKKSDIDDYVKLYTSKDLRKGIDVVSGTEYTNNYIISNTEQTPYTIKIGCCGDNYPASFKHFRGCIKSFKLWSSDTLLLDLIPVRIGQIGYMYDKVSGKLFANKGTGNFVLGADVNNPVPKIRNVVYSGVNRCVMPMPYDSKIEYLESTGTQYINTDIYTSNTIGFEINAMGLSGAIQYHAAGFYKDYSLNNVCVFGSAHGGIVGCFGGDVHGYTSPGRIVASNYNWQNEMHICKLNKGSFYVDGNLIGSTSYTLTSFNKIWIGAINNIAKQSGRIYGAKVWENDVLIRDLIPVRRGNVGYLYDKVSGKLFGNSGTGQFILGNDIND